MLGMAMCCAAQQARTLALAHTCWQIVSTCTYAYGSQRLEVPWEHKSVSPMKSIQTEGKPLTQDLNSKWVISSSFFWFVTYKPLAQHYMQELWVEWQCELSALAPLHGGNHEKCSNHEIFITNWFTLKWFLAISWKFWTTKIWNYTVPC